MIAPLRRAHEALVALWLLPVRLYRRFVSPLKTTGSCRFQPTCSRYAIDAVREWGILCGTAMTAWRILRCNPFSRGGYDPVPTRQEVKERLAARRGKNRTPSPDNAGAGTSPDKDQSQAER